MNEQTKQPETWAVCELMGHVKIAGRLTEEEKFGVKMARLDIPISMPCEACAGSGQVAFMSATPCSYCNGTKIETNFATQYFGGSSVYRISIVTEAVARHVSQINKPSTVSPCRTRSNSRPRLVERMPEPEDFDDDDDPEDDESQEPF